MKKTAPQPQALPARKHTAPAGCVFVKAATGLENAFVQAQAIRAEFVAAWLTGGEAGWLKAFREKRPQLDFYKSSLMAMKEQTASRMRQKNAPEIKALLADLIRIIDSFRIELRSLSHPPLDCLVRDFAARAAKKGQP